MVVMYIIMLAISSNTHQLLREASARHSLEISCTTCTIKKNIWYQKLMVSWSEWSGFLFVYIMQHDLSKYILHVYETLTRHRWFSIMLVIIVYIAASTASPLESAQSASPYILLANERFIHQLSLDGSRLRTIVSEPNQAIFMLDYHIRCNKN